MKISNKTARRIAIQSAGLSTVATGACDKARLLQIIKQLGYVQLDPLQVIARAHDHILWSRNNRYQPSTLEQLLEDKQIFEHFCHDACFLPMDTLPYWKNQFKRQSHKRTSLAWREQLTNKDKNAIVNRIKNEGALRSNDFKSDNKAPKVVWSKPEHKKILDFLWLGGELAVTKRTNFAKYYNLASECFPSTPTKSSRSQSAINNYLSTHAMNCLGFANAGDVMRFWDAIDLEQVKKWCASKQADLSTVQVESYNGDHTDYFVRNATLKQLTKPIEPTKRIRIINPFDPLVRDRKKLERIFGFEYRIEIYTPPTKRQYGYYVYPLLEFDRFVGRLEIKHDRKSNELQVLNLWPESGVKFGDARMKKLHSEIERVRRFVSADTIVW